MADQLGGIDRVVQDLGAVGHLKIERNEARRAHVRADVRFELDDHGVAAGQCNRLGRDDSFDLAERSFEGNDDLLVNHFGVIDEVRAADDGDRRVDRREAFSIKAEPERRNTSDQHNDHHRKSRLPSARGASSDGSNHRPARRRTLAGFG